MSGDAAGSAPRRRFYRFRLRGLIAFVAVAAVLCVVGLRLVPWGWRLYRQSQDARETAAFSESNRKIDLRLVAQHEARARTLEDEAHATGDPSLIRQAREERRQADYYRRMERYHARLAGWYRRAAARPWATIPGFPEAPPPP